MKKFQPTKTHYTIFFTILVIFFLILFLSTWNFGDDQKIILGGTFSKKHADHLGLDWKLVYWKTINEMPFKIIRMPVYWDEVEKKPGELNFSDYQWMLDLAEEKGIEIVPVLGRRVPRWPECHQPEFYNQLSNEEMKQKILTLIKTEVAQFKKYDNIKKWQIDNEPFLDVFGECPQADANLLAEEIALVKSLDSRPIMITESGELSSWLKGAKIADILGVSMYRETWNKNWGWFQYPLPPAYYFLKAKFVQYLTGVKKVINTELQAEPWAINSDLKTMDLADQKYSLDLTDLKDNLEFAKRAGQEEIYLWGVEWWYWLGQTYGQWDFWNYMKNFK
ncbi:MAG TPA: cellulase family glycosylhydrolase [bacterium]|nr:cellulase family glycosylhydrolase [bacterium]